MISVLDVALEGRKWLVCERYAFADLAFLGWDTFLAIRAAEGGK